MFPKTPNTHMASKKEIVPNFYNIVSQRAELQMFFSETKGALEFQSLEVQDF